MKKNPMLEKIDRRHQAELYATRIVTRQEAVDCARIALNEEFGFGPERCRQFMGRFNKVFKELCDMTEGDTLDYEYTREKFEERMRQVDGKYYCPREERYSINGRQ